MTRTPVSGIGMTLALRDLVDPSALPGGIAFVEVLAEDVMGDGGTPPRTVTRLRERLPLAIRSGGLGIGGEPDRSYLARLAALCDRLAPFLVTEQLAWASHAAVDAAAGAPPLTEVTLQRTCRHALAARLRLGRRVALETPVQCEPAPGNVLAPGAFLRGIIERTGCTLVLDLRHAWLWAGVLGQDPIAHLAGYPLGHVAAIRVPALGDVGPTCARGGRTDTRMIEAIWGLLAWVLYTNGPRPVFLDWQGARPDSATVAAEAERAGTIIRQLAEGTDDTRAS